MNVERATARCWAEIDLDVIAGNYDTARRACGEGTRVIPVLKANAYGLGAARVARLLASLGASLFAVAEYGEALEVMRASNRPALVMGMVPPALMADAVRAGVVVTAYSTEMARALDEAARRAGRDARVHIKVDTGMHRLGLDADAAPEEAAAICRLPHLRVEGLFTHLALRNRAEDERQIERLLKVAAALRGEGLDYGLLHAADSIGMVRYPAFRFDAVRTGAWLYGVTPRGCPNPGDCRPPARFMTRVVQLRRVSKGECLGYDEDHPLARDSVIATLSCGYADGYPRVNSAGFAMIRGRRAPVAGLVCMDQFTVDVTDIPDVRPGDPVTLWGGEVTLDEAAEWSGTNRNDLLSRLGRRVPRVYRQGGEVVGID